MQINAASKSTLAHTYVPSPGQERTFQKGQIQTPEMPLSFSFVFIAFHDLHCQLRIAKLKNVRRNINFCQK